VNQRMFEFACKQGEKTACAGLMLLRDRTKSDATEDEGLTQPEREDDGQTEPAD
jgi:hypothetical protein